MNNPQSKKSVLICWIGATDLEAAEGIKEAGSGPVAQAVDWRAFDYVLLLSDYPAKKSRNYVKWLSRERETEIELRICELSSPTHFGEIYQNVNKAIDHAHKQCGDNVSLTFHLSPGTSAMAAVWILVAKTRHFAELIESSQQYGVRVANVPFDISAEFIPSLLRKTDEDLVSLSTGRFEGGFQFESIIHRSIEMQQIKAKASKIAPRSIPVLIEGESGTGKELLAQEIHQSSPRADKPFIAVNCGAIPRGLVEAEFFGSKKGAFTGAEDRPGHFENAHRGTLFLDEIGELPLDAQVKLLRVVQEEKVTRVGESKLRKVDVRIIAATNKNIMLEVSEGRFRQDLFYRLAVAIIGLPPLRKREGDIGLLTDHFLKLINRDMCAEPSWQNKKLSSGARNFLLSHTWPGNIRELRNTLLRAVVFSPLAIIEEKDIQEAVLTLPKTDESNVMNRDVSQGVDLQSIIGEVAMHYLDAALKESNGNMSKAAEKVGLPSYQTFKNWREKYSPQ